MPPTFVLLEERTVRYLETAFLAYHGFVHKTIICGPFINVQFGSVDVLIRQYKAQLTVGCLPSFTETKWDMVDDY